MRGYIKIGSFEGEATDTGHEGWSIIQSISAPISHSMGGFSGSERGKGQTSLGDISIVKEMDNSSVKLQKACASGEKISKVEIHLCTVLSDKREPFLIYELEDAFITSYQFAAQITENSGVPTESVSFNFNKITWTYMSYGQDGKKRGKLKESYKIGENK